MKRRGGSEIEVRKEKLKRWGIKGAGWLRAAISHFELSPFEILVPGENSYRVVA